MIPNHAGFIGAIREKLKVSVHFYSAADSGALDRICAPLEYGRANEFQDGLNRYWFWDYASTSGSHILSLAPEQVLDLRILGEVFDPAKLNATGL